MNENTINERKKTDIGTGVQMSKELQYKSPAPWAITTSKHEGAFGCMK